MKADKARIERAKEVELTETNGGKYIAQGKYTVELSDDGNSGGCTCVDFEKRRMPCKHMIALAVKKGLKVEEDKSSKSSGSKPATNTYAKYSAMGYDKYEVISSFHKELRRKDKAKATWWLQVMLDCGESAWYLSNYIAGAINEELCLCDGMGVIGIKSTLNYKTLDEYGLYMATMKFVDYKKWWECDYCSQLRDLWGENLKIIRNDKPSSFEKIPEYAIDRHTRQGKSKIESGAPVDRRWEGSWLGMWFRRNAFLKAKKEGCDIDDFKKLSDVLSQEEIKYWLYRDNNNDKVKL